MSLLHFYLTCPIFLLSAPNDSATSADDVWKCAAQGEAAAVAGLRELRLQGDDPRASTQSSLKVLVDGVAAAEGQELLITEVRACRT